MEKNFCKVGFINIKEDDYAVVADPCYDLDSRWIEVVEIKRGMYDCYIEEKYFGMWGKRVSRLAILKDSFGVEKLNECGELVNDVAVDSGTMGIYAYHYFAETHDNDVDEDWYNKFVCSEWSNNYRLCEDGGVISSSGFGDGMYAVYYYRDDKDNVIGIEVVFIEDDEEKENEDED